VLGNSSLMCLGLFSQQKHSDSYVSVCLGQHLGSLHVCIVGGCGVAVAGGLMMQ